MKKTVIKLLAATVCIMMLAASLSSCMPMFFDDGYNFTGLDGILTLIFGNNVRKEDNAFVAYADAAGKYHIYANGEEIDTVLDFGGAEVKISPSADNWFAYVYSGEEVFVIYADGTSELLTLSGEVICASPIYPAIVCKEYNDLYLHGDNGLSKVIVDGNADGVENIYMSDYGDMVVYSKEGKSYMFIDDETFEILEDGMVPVGISDLGQYIFGRYVTGGDNALYVYDSISENLEKIPDSNRFLRIIDISTNGSEILFITGKDPTIVSDPIHPNDGDMDSDICSYVYNTKNKETYKLGEGIYYPKDIKGNVAVFGDFKDMYFDVYDDDGSGERPVGTAYVDKKYNSETVSEYEGEINADGDYLYYLDRANTLWQVDLGSGKEKDVKDSVESFKVTVDGDVYVLTAANELYFIKGKKLSDERIAENVAYVTYYTGGEALYYELNNREVWLAEGKKTEKTDFNGLPVFTNAVGKNTYVYTSDGVGNWSVYYTYKGEKTTRLTNSASRICNITFEEE